MLQRRVDHGAPLADGIRQRLLDEHVLARLAGMDRRQRVPVVRRGHHHRIQFFPLEQLAEVVELLGLLSLRLFDESRGAVEVRLIQIAHSHGGHVGVFHELVEAGRALLAQPDEAELKPVAGGRSVGASGGSRQPEPCRRHLHKRSSVGCHLHHNQSAYANPQAHATVDRRL